MHRPPQEVDRVHGQAEYLALTEPAAGADDGRGAEGSRVAGGDGLDPLGLNPYLSYLRLPGN